MEKNQGSDSRAAQRNLNRHLMVCEAYRAALDSQVGPPLTPRSQQHTHNTQHSPATIQCAEAQLRKMQPTRRGHVAKSLARAETDAFLGLVANAGAGEAHLPLPLGALDGHVDARLKGRGNKKESDFFFCLIVARVLACLSALPSARRSVSLHSRGCADSSRQSTTTKFREAAGAKRPPMRMGCVWRVLF
jgi:hypothetical protein